MNQCRFIKETLIFWLHSSVLALEKQPKKLNFQSFSTYNRPFGGYFQCNACTYFEKICISTRYSQEKMIRNVSNFLVALPRFCFKKQPKNLSFQSITTCKTLRWLLSIKPVNLTPENMVLKQI